MNINGLMMALATRADGTYPPFSAEGLLYAAKMTLLGMGAVFAVLVALMLVVKLMGQLFAKSAVQAAKAAEKADREARRAQKEAEKAEKRQKAEEPVAAEPVVTEIPATVSPATESDDALVAILAAAIAAYRAAENPDEMSAGGFRVVSFRRAGGGRSWNANK